MFGSSISQSPKVKVGVGKKKPAKHNRLFVLEDAHPHPVLMVLEPKIKLALEFRPWFGTSHEDLHVKVTTIPTRASVEEEPLKVLVGARQLIRA
jgi:hypothetical protein